MPANITGIGTSWNLPNYAGELFSSDQGQTPFLSMIGGLTGGLMTESDEFSTAVLFNNEQPTQPNISETASVTAPPAKLITREQKTNVVQIFQETVEMTYHKMATKGKLAGLNVAGQQANPPSEWDFQVAQKLILIARQVEYTFWRGTYQKSTAANVANRTRGILELAAAGTNIDADGDALGKDLMDQLVLEMVTNGALLGNMVCFAPGKQRQRITARYENQVGYNAPAPRNIGGMSVTVLENDFFSMGVVFEPYLPADTIAIVDMSVCAPVFLETPGKGVLFEEPLPSTGANKRSQIYGEIGLDHGPAFAHGIITGLEA